MSVMMDAACYHTSMWRMSCPDLNERPWLQRRECSLQAWHEGNESLKLIRMCHEHNNRDRKSRNILLVRKVPINGDECLELGSSQCQQCTVLYSTPAHFNGGFYDVCR